MTDRAVTKEEMVNTINVFLSYATEPRFVDLPKQLGTWWIEPFRAIRDLIEKYGPGPGERVAPAEGGSTPPPGPIESSGEAPAPRPDAGQVEEALAYMDKLLAYYEGRAHDVEGHAALRALREATKPRVDRLIPYRVYFHRGENPGTMMPEAEPVKFRCLTCEAHDATEALAKFKEGLNSLNWEVDEVLPLSEDEARIAVEGEK